MISIPLEGKQIYIKMENKVEKIFSGKSIQIKKDVILYFGTNFLKIVQKDEFKKMNINFQTDNGKLIRKKRTQSHGPKYFFEIYGSRVTEGWNVENTSAFI